VDLIFIRSGTGWLAIAIFHTPLHKIDPFGKMRKGGSFPVHFSQKKGMLGAIYRNFNGYFDGIGKCELKNRACGFLDYRILHFFFKL